MNPPATDHLLYLHGFRSSPASFKALRMQAWLAHNRPDVHWWCPQLPVSPRQAMDLVGQRLATWPAGRFALIGSSLGGFYATCLAEAHGCAAVLLNPAVDPARDLQPHVGALTAYHDSSQRLHFEAGFVDELRAMTPPTLSRPERYCTVIAKGDELLDWREMSRRYAGSTMRLIDGSDHGLSDFNDHLPFVLRFLRLVS